MTEQTTDTKSLNLYQKLLKITEAVGTIEKTGRNSTQNYAFIEQSQIVAEIRPQLAKWGVIILPETPSRTIERYDVTRSNGKQGVDIYAKVASEYTVINADKPKERFTAKWDAGEAIDSSDKATNKAVTASHKSYLMKLFNISDKEDADRDSPDVPVAPEPATKMQKAQITAYLRSQGVEDSAIVIVLRDDFKVQGDLTRDEANRVLGEIVKLKAAAKDDGVMAE